MRRIYLRLTHDSDLRVGRGFSQEVWHIYNKSENSAIVRQGILRRSIVLGCYLTDHSRMSVDRILSRDDYLPL